MIHISTYVPRSEVVKPRGAKWRHQLILDKVLALAEQGRRRLILGDCPDHPESLVDLFGRIADAGR